MTCYFWINRNGDVWSSVILRACWRKISKDISFFFSLLNKRKLKSLPVLWIFASFVCKNRPFLLTKTFVPYKMIQLWSIFIYSRDTLLCTTQVTMIKIRRFVNVRCKWLAIVPNPAVADKNWDANKIFTRGPTCLAANAITAHGSAASSWNMQMGCWRECAHSQSAYTGDIEINASSRNFARE